MWPYGHDWGWGWGWAMVISMVVFWALLIAAFVYAVSALGRTGRGWGGPPESAREILDRRYARGELTREQYEQMRQDLLRHGNGSAPTGA